MEQIEGILVKNLRLVPDDRGWVMEIVRNDDPLLFSKFGQVYITACYPGVIKAWHAHYHRTELFACVSGMAKLAAYDNRKESPTFSQINEFIMGEKNPVIVRIPPGVMHGYTPIGDTVAMLVNVPTEVYNHSNPDEIRRPFDDPEIGYDWSVQNK